MDTPFADGEPPAQPETPHASPPLATGEITAPPPMTATPMTLGMVGLGKMGLNMAARLVLGGHRVVGFDLSADNVRVLEEQGGEGASSVGDLIGKLGAPGERAVWVMVPAGTVTESVVADLAGRLSTGDTILDGGNSKYTGSVERGERLAETGIHFVDVGTSGGIWGLREGYSMMIGGDAAAVERLRPLFEVLAPSPTTGWGRVGPTGAGHYTKMVHNGIEYGMMQAFAEGFHVLEAKTDFALDLHQVAEIWRTGSVVRSWLLDLCAKALAHNPDLSGIAPYVSDSGEGRWTIEAATELNVPTPVITAALYERLRSRLGNSYTDRMLAALRNEFGGHGFVKQTPDALPRNPIEGGDAPTPPTTA